MTAAIPTPQPSSKARLRVDNPLPGGHKLIRPRAAQRLVKLGLAIYTSATSVTLLQNCHDQANGHAVDHWLWQQRQKAQELFERVERPRLIAKLGYDRVDRTLTLKELSNIPFVGHLEHLMTLKTRRGN